MNINDLAITSLETITAFDCVTGAYKFTLDELQNANIANSQEKQDVTGKQGRKLTSLKRNKAVKITGTNGLVSGGLLEVQTGSTFTNKVTEVLWTDYLKVTNNKATTTYKAVGTAGAEIDEIYIRNTDGSTAKLNATQGTAATNSGTFTYTPNSKELEFNASDVSGVSEIVVYYKRNITADVLSNDSDKYSGKCVLYIDAMAEDKCARVYRVQFFIPKADFSGEFGLELGGNQAVHAFEAESLAGACGAGSSLWTYTVFGANAADYTDPAPDDDPEEDPEEE